MKKITKNTPHWRIALETLRGWIIDGKLMAGEKLTEGKLAEKLSISRTPLREALLQLEQEGLVVRNPGGFSAASFTLIDVLDSIEIRGHLEGAAVRYAVEHGIEPSRLERLQETLNKIDKTVLTKDRVKYGELNTIVHEEFAALASSQLIRSEVLRSYRYPFAHPSAFPTNIAGTNHLVLTIEDGQKQHKEIFETIILGDGRKASELMLQHARHAMANVEAAYLEKIKTNKSIPALALVTS
ncbi:MAG: GntR family transcriptional regulator [Rhodobacteraceae bacterium]|nr:MAG: GntR family transcriptional regulator [Paracoccaceae bacterium]